MADSNRSTAAAARGMRGGAGLASAVDFAAVRYFDDEDGDDRVLDPGDGAVIADAVAPEAGPVADHRLAEAVRIADAIEVFR